MGGIGTGKREGRFRSERGGQQRRRTKSCTLLGGVQEYWGYTRGRETIRFGFYNICNVRNGGLESVLRGMYQANMDLVIFKKLS